MARALSNSRTGRNPSGSRAGGADLVAMSFTQRSRSRIDQALKQAPWRTQAQATSLLTIMVLVVVVIGAFYVAQASRTAAAGRRLQVLDGERQVLEQQNAQLRAEVASLRSVPRLIGQAE